MKTMFVAPFVTCLFASHAMARSVVEQFFFDSRVDQIAITGVDPAIAPSVFAFAPVGIPTFTAPVN